MYNMQVRYIQISPWDVREGNFTQLFDFVQWVRKIKFVGLPLLSTSKVVSMILTYTSKVETFAVP